MCAEKKMANRRLVMKPYLGFSITRINGCRYVASKDGDPSKETIYAFSRNSIRGAIRSSVKCSKGGV